jgi:hypothetical protein
VLTQRFDISDVSCRVRPFRLVYHSVSLACSKYRFPSRCLKTSLAGFLASPSSHLTSLRLLPALVLLFLCTRGLSLIGLAVACSSLSLFMQLWSAFRSLKAFSLVSPLIYASLREQHYPSLDSRSTYFTTGIIVTE